MQSLGSSVPSLVTLAQYHPQFALAICAGIAMRPNLRPLSIELQNSQIGNPQPTSFSEVIAQYSVFGGCELTIDPTNNLVGNPLKYPSDATQPATSGITFTMLVQCNDGTNYAPVPEDTPLQSVARAFESTVGIWHMGLPENVKAKFTLQSPFEGPGPITPWLVFTFWVLAAGGQEFLNLSTPVARAQLAKYGYGPPYPVAA